MSALSTTVLPKFPIWDANEKKLKNHYQTEELINVLNLIDDTHWKIVAAKGEEEVTIDAINIGRVISKMRTPPGPVMQWVHRVLRIYYCPELCTAVKNKTVSSRYALSDLANRVGDLRYRDLLNQACAGTITNAEFRKQSKLIQGK